MYYKGWTLDYVSGAGTQPWFARRFGVQMRARSKAELKTMIDLRLA